MEIRIKQLNKIFPGDPKKNIRDTIAVKDLDFTVEDGNVDITSRSEEGNVNEHLSAEINGDNIVIGFNSKYLIDVLKAISDDEIAFEMGTSVSSCLIKPVDGDAYTYLVLPVRITAA